MTIRILYYNEVHIRAECWKWRQMCQMCCRENEWNVFFALYKYSSNINRFGDSLQCFVIIEMQHMCSKEQQKLQNNKIKKYKKIYIRQN